MLILMFFFHFWVVVDGKIHCQAQQRCFLNLYLILTCLMSPHDNWHFPIIMWKGGLEWKKSLKFNKILTTDYKSQFFWKCVQNLMVWRLFRDLYRFLKTSVIMWGHPHVDVRKMKTVCSQSFSELFLHSQWYWQAGKKFTGSQVFKLGKKYRSTV